MSEDRARNEVAAKAKKLLRWLAARIETLAIGAAGGLIVWFLTTSDDPVAILVTSVGQNGISATSVASPEIFVTVENTIQGEPARDVHWGWVTDSMVSGTGTQEQQFLKELGRRVQLARLREELLQSGPPENDRQPIHLSENELEQIRTEIRNIYVRVHADWEDRVGSHRLRHCYRFDPISGPWRRLPCS